MSGLNKQASARQHTPIEGLIDPTVELTQPGGPFPYGDALLTDGAGGYTVAPTLRPYLLTFRFSKLTGVEPGGVSYCDHQGVSTDEMGVPVPLPTNLIGIAIVLSHPAKNDQRFSVEVFQFKDESTETLALLEIGAGARRGLRRDLSIGLDAGAELGVRLHHIAGEKGSAFSRGIITIELEG